MKVTSIGLLIALAGLTGCAPLVKSTPSDDATSAYSDSEKAVDNHKKAPEKPDLANQHQVDKHKKTKEVSAEDVETISPEAFYYMLSGEIAGQRNQFNLSADSYLRAAKLTNSPQIAARAVQVALYAKDYDKAMDAVTVWTDAEPENISARKLEAGLQLKQGKTQQAIDNYVYVLSVPDVDFEKSTVQIAHSIQGNTSEPYPVLDALDQRFPNTAEMPFSYALVAAKLKDFKIAENKLDQALAIRPDWDSALLLKIKLVAQSGDTTRAIQMLEQATTQFPDNAEIHMLYAKLLAMQQDYPKAIEHFQRVIDLDPDDSDAGFALAIMHSALGDYDLARDGLLTLAKNPQNRQRAYLQLGQLAAENKMYDEALSWLDQVESGALGYDAQIFASEILLEQKQVDEALDRLRKLRNQYPQQSIAIALREADIYSQNKQPDNAIEVLDSALETKPQEKELLYMRSLLADQVGNYGLAESDLQAVLAIEPDNVNALNALGYILCNRTGRLEDAEQYLERAIKLKPDDPAIMDSIGWLRFRQGNFNAALKYLQPAYQQKNDVEIGAHLAEVYWMLDRQNDAKKVLQEAWIKDSTHDSLLQMQKRFPAAFSDITSK
jgi:tetratricopeptide (TPR) repeat protein